MDISVCRFQKREFDYVLKLPDITGVIVLLEQIHCASRLRGLFLQLLHKETHQLGYIVLAVPERRQ